MTDEPTTIQVTVGPYAGQRLTMPAADAAAAIADKWAIDPNAPPPKEGEEKEAKPMSDEELTQIKAAAEKAARKLRGEPEPDTKPEPAHKLHSEPEAPLTRDIVAERPATYPTKTAPAKK